MRKQFKQEFFTRRAIVQNVYSHMCESMNESHEEQINPAALNDLDVDQSFFRQIMQNVRDKWNAFSVEEYEQKGQISRCAKAILRAGFCELEMNAHESKMIIDQYLEISKLFCEKETRVINKILDARLKQLQN